MELIPRKDDKPVIAYVNPSVELNAGLWTLFAAATTFLGLRLWSKVKQRHGLWYDDHILITSWVSVRNRLCRSFMWLRLVKTKQTNWRMCMYCSVRLILGM